MITIKSIIVSLVSFISVIYITDSPEYQHLCNSAINQYIQCMISSDDYYGSQSETCNTSFLIIESIPKCLKIKKGCEEYAVNIIDHKILNTDIGLGIQECWDNYVDYNKPVDDLYQTLFNEIRNINNSYECSILFDKKICSQGTYCDWTHNCSLEPIIITP